MMLFPKAKIESAASSVSDYGTEVMINGSDVLVIGESSQSINEFETQLAAQSVEWDGESVDGHVLLRVLTDIQGQRTEFRKRYNDEWQARYSIRTE